MGVSRLNLSKPVIAAVKGIRKKNIYFKKIDL